MGISITKNVFIGDSKIPITQFTVFFFTTATDIRCFYLDTRLPNGIRRMTKANSFIMT